MSVLWVGAGIAAVGVISASSSANKAAKIQENAANRAAETGDRQYDQTRIDQLAQYEQQRVDQKPYRDAALPSIQNLSQGLQPGGEYDHAFTLQDYQADPGYGFRLAEGEKGINRAAAARGGWNSGATLKALSRFNSDQASQEYGAAYSRFNTDKTTKFNRNATMAGYGQTANSAVGNAGTNAYNQIANAGNQNSIQQQQALQNAGEARASGYAATGNAIGSGIRQLYNGYQQNSYNKPPTAGSYSDSGAAGTYFDGYGNVPIGSS